MSFFSRLPRSGPYLKGALRSLSRFRPFWLVRLAHGADETVVTLKGVGSHDLRILVNTRDHLMSKSLLWTGTYERHLTRVMLDRLKPEDSVVDIGANLGYFTVLMASCVPRGRVYAFEPDPGNLRLLRTNIALNGFQDRVELYPVALAESAGEVILTNLDDPNGGGRMTMDSAADVDAVFGASFSRQSVASRSWDSMFTEPPQIALIKIDVEGYEPKVFSGMEKMLRAQRPVILMEFSPINIERVGKRDARALMEWLFGMGYRASGISFRTGAIHPIGQNYDTLWDFYKEHGSADHVDLVLEAVAATVR
jgi:FkbM family methyltransferase